MPELDLRDLSRISELCCGRRLSSRGLKRAKAFADEFEHQLQKREPASRKLVCDK